MFALAAAGLFSFFAASCNDLLDEPAENISYTDVTDYTLSANMINPLIGVYAKFYALGWEYVPLVSVRGDDVNAGGLGDQQDYAETDNFKYNKDYWMYNSVWQTSYTDVFHTLSAIDEINKYKDAGANATLAAQYVAESQTIQAFLLFQTSRLWGAILIPTKNDPTSLLTVDLTEKDEVMRYISDMMDQAIPALPDKHPADRTDVTGGITKYTALAMKALANLELKNYQVVADATSQIIQSGKFRLESDFYSLFKIKGKLNRENVLEWQFSDYGSGSGDENTHLFGFYGPQGWTPKVANSGDGWGFYEPSMKYIKFMLDRGETVRLETSVLFTNRGIAELKKEAKYATLPSWISNTTRSGDVINDYARALFASGKHYLPSDELTPGRTAYGTNKNMTCIRYAEILLMHAEALTNGATSTSVSATEAVNLVRARAGMSSLSNVTNAQVMDEKFAELAMEWGIRYFDMIRLDNNAELSYDGRTFDASKKYLPYPQTQVDQLPVLKGK